MTKKERYAYVIDYFSKHQPNVTTELRYKTTYELLVAVVLSAQCTDKRVNMVTPVFFRHFPSPVQLAEASIEEIFEVVKSISYPNSKSKYLKGIATMLIKDFNGNVPDNMEDLQKLPGVGRKTANVILSVAFNQPAMAVDTHVFRVAARIGLTHNAKNPLDTEKQLIEHIPQELISKAHHWLILHGRYVCVARKPLCSQCGIKEVCQYFQKNINKNTSL
ncbi:MAG TPA: endonuclease III [Bacteroidales bacterium]|jgi:endonuclease-3|nr:endonuclease III [Bacteroidales bacterium]HOR82758.1 endonuclease III [Bacteroidales bacterium]HPJ91974.1 endonuclease III [Bacteroidales bacterium]HQB20736.1 endonuclease III [Bacteroidales bacterium]